MGHNNPPTLLEQLSEDYAQLRHEVEKIADRANTAPRAIKTDSDLDTVGNLIKDASALSRKADASRKAAKDPSLQAGRDVDTFFKQFSERLERIQSTFQKLADDHAKAKAAEARRKAEEEAKRLREEEERQREIARRAEESNRAKTADKHEAKADEVAERAAEAEQAAQASAADLTRTRTASGTLATAQTEWAFEVIDFDAIPLNQLRPYFKREEVEKAVRAFMKTGRRELAGVRFFEDVKARFR